MAHGVDARWGRDRGHPEFFALTKRIHNRLHGWPGEGGPLGPEERRVYVGVLEAKLAELEARVRPGDLAIVHDPQPAGSWSR